MVFCVVLLAGCDSWEDKCERSCDYTGKCAEAKCTDSDIEHCAENLEAASDDCQKAFDGWVECLDENENDCQDVDKECRGESNDVTIECENDFD